MSRRPGKGEMRILFVVPYTPNLIRVRPYNLIRGLAARGHPVTVATLWSSPQEQADLHPDVMHIEHLRGARYGLRSKSQKRSAPLAK